MEDSDSRRLGESDEVTRPVDFSLSHSHTGTTSMGVLVMSSGPPMSPYKFEWNVSPWALSDGNRIQGLIAELSLPSDSSDF